MAHGLTTVLLVLLVVVSAGGAFGSTWLYRDNPLISATFRGQDWVTLLVAVPLLAVGLVLEHQGSRRGRLLWLAMLFSVMYSYLFYAVGAAFNVFFLLYVAIVGLALYALVLALPGLQVEPLAAAVSGRAVRWVAIGYLLVIAAGLGLLWTGLALSFLFTGIVPAAIVASGHPTGVVFAIDLVFIVPPMLVGAVGLIRGRAGGWVPAAVMSVSGAVYTLSLAAASISVNLAGAGTEDELALWGLLTVFGASTTLLLFAGKTRLLAQSDAKVAAGG